MTKIVIAGFKGRMGQALLACAPQHPNLKVVAQIARDDHLASIINKADVVIDFSSHQASLEIVEACIHRNKALVIGTTGHSPKERSRIGEAGRCIPIVFSSNFSTGVNALFWLTRKAAEILGPGFDLEVVEMHHRNKQDAPSGTARTLAEILAGVRNLQLNKALRHGRSGITGERTPQEIGMHSLRGGDVVGDHTVVFATPGERIELTHKASSRETFADGALRAAEWVVKQSPGCYDMQDVLGLKQS